MPGKPKLALSVAGFKSYRSRQTLSLAPLTLLIGANASGKSNLLEALQFLSWLARGGRLSDLPRALQGRELPIRGLVRDLAGSDGLLEFGVDLDTLHLESSLDLRSDPGRVVHEKLQDSDAPGTVPYLYELVQSIGRGWVTVEYNNFSRGPNKPQVSLSDQLAVFAQLRSPVALGATHGEARSRIPEACERLVQALGDMLFLSPEPRDMRGYCPRDDHMLRPSGANLSAVLWDLHRQGRKDEVLAFVRSLPEQDIRGMEFHETPRNEVMVRLLETFGGQEHYTDAAVLSDGTLRVLAVAAAVLSSKPGTLVVIEELDSGVHSSRAAALMSRLHSEAKRRDLRLLLTTHNPAVLDAVPDEVFPDCVACYRDPTTGDSRLQRLGDHEDFVSLAARGPLGALSRSGLLDRFLKVRPTAEDRERAREELLDLFRSAS